MLKRGMLALAKRFTNEASWRPRQAKDTPSYLTGTLATKMLVVAA